MRNLSVVLLILCFVGCAQQPPAKVVVAQPTTKRQPAKKTAKIHTATLENNKQQVSKPVTKRTENKPTATPNKITRIENNLNWAWPAKGSILTNFAAHQDTFKGIDISGTEGTPILAACDGEVVYSGDSLRGYGNLIIIKHQKNFLSAYAHNRKNMVKEGDKVKLGQRIAEMGQTGTDKVKLHFEVRYQGKPVDPQGILPAN